MPRKPKSAKAVILPPDLDDDSEEEHVHGVPDDDGWIHVETIDGCSDTGGRNTVSGETSKAQKRVVRRTPKRRAKRPG